MRRRTRIRPGSVSSRLRHFLAIPLRTRPSRARFDCGGPIGASQKLIPGRSCVAFVQHAFLGFSNKFLQRFYCPGGRLLQMRTIMLAVAILALNAAANDSLAPWASNTQPGDAPKKHVEQIAGAGGETHTY